MRSGVLSSTSLPPNGSSFSFINQKFSDDFLPSKYPRMSENSGRRMTRSAAANSDSVSQFESIPSRGRVSPPSSSEDSEIESNLSGLRRKRDRGSSASNLEASSTCANASFVSAYISTSQQRPRHRLLDQDGLPIKKSKLENDSCRDLVSIFAGRMDIDRLPSADEIVAIVLPVIPQTEKDIYTAWISPAHRPATIENVLQSASHLLENNQPNIDHYLKAVNKRREHDLGRNHTAPAVFWMIMTALLMEHSYPDQFIRKEDSILGFEETFPVLINKARSYKRMPNFHLHLHKASIFLEILFKLIKADGFLEVCLLIVSCLEGRGKHHQRSGNNRPFPARAYRYLIEKMGGKADVEPSLLNEFETT